MTNETQLADPPFTDSPEIHDHLQRILASERFRKTPSLRHLLEYLVIKTLQGEQDHIKESTVAIDVFGRDGDFDSRIDNIVRVHAHRLRKLLEAHYEGEGAPEKIRISIPKGGYIAQVHLAALRTASAESPEVESRTVVSVFEPALAARPRLAAAASRRRAIVQHLAAFFLGALILFLILLASGRISTSRHPTLVAGENLRTAPLSAIWMSILRPGVNCIVSFTNPVFLWTDTSRSRLYMTYRGPVSVPLGTRMELAPDDPFVDPDIARKSGPFFFSDSWTGTGEVMAVQKLTRLFTEANFPLKVVRSRVLNYSDMKGANVIFLGSPWANDMQDKFNIGATPLICRNNEAIVNMNPKPGDPTEFRSLWVKETGELVASYGLFSVLPGITPGTKIVTAAGLNTYATSATMDYMTNPNSVRELMRRFGTLDRKTLPEFFQAVIRTEIIKGEPAGSSLVMVRSVSK